MINAKIIEDSVNIFGNRLTTFELIYPRFILAELNTHRMFSRNSSSSRAIPIIKMIKDILSNPATPVYWGENKAGMQAGEELKGIKLKLAKLIWRIASYNNILYAYILYKLGLHKQISNRILEPWMYTRTIVSATEWDNFFELRCHPDAQPEIKELATLMRLEYNSSKPKLLRFGEWHLPYITAEERNTIPLKDCIKMSVARCARVSYLTHDGKTPNKNKDFELYERLVGSVPIHASPTEHQATPANGSFWKKNFKGWEQHRIDVENRIKMLS